jgi:transposase
MLATAARLGGRWHVDSIMENLCRAARRERATRLERIFHGRHLHAGQKRGAAIGPTRRGKGTKLMVVADGTGLPIGEFVSSASPGEVTLAEATLNEIRHGSPKRLIADRAYDSDALRTRLADAGIELVCPHRRGRKRAATQDGRALRRYRRRWKIERVFSWLFNFRRLTTRWEYYPFMFRAFVHVAMIMITLKRF